MTVPRIVVYVTVPNKESGNMRSQEVYLNDGSIEVANLHCLFLYDLEGTRNSSTFSQIICCQISVNSSCAVFWRFCSNISCGLDIVYSDAFLSLPSKSHQ